MEACTIFSTQNNVEAILPALNKILGPENIQIEGSPQAWTVLDLKRRRLLSTGTLRLTLQHQGPALDNMVQGMMHVFAAVPTEHTAIRTALLARIRQFKMAIGITSKRLAGMDDIIFEVAKAIDGLVFWTGNQILDPKARLILDFKGATHVTEFDGARQGPAPVAAPDLNEEDAARKAKSEAILKARKVPINANLPLTVGAHTQLRSLEEVVHRALALCLVALKGEGLGDPTVERIQADYQIAPHLSPLEQAFIADPVPDPQARTNATWRYESLWVLLWALGHIPSLDFPDRICEPATAVGIIHQAQNQTNFLQSSQLRSRDEILDATDLILRLHWAVIDARLRGVDPPANILPGIAFERHYALNWLTNYHKLDWDHVRTDT